MSNITNNLNADFHFPKENEDESNIPIVPPSVRLFFKSYFAEFPLNQALSRGKKFDANSIQLLSSQKEGESHLKIPPQSDLAELKVSAHGVGVKLVKSPSIVELRKQLTHTHNPAEVSDRISSIVFQEPEGCFLCTQYAFGKVFNSQDPVKGCIFSFVHPKHGPKYGIHTRARADWIAKKYLQATLDPQKGDLVIYYDKHGNPVHFGIYQKDGLVESKWGTKAVYLHPIFAVCKFYGCVAAFFKTGPNLEPETIRANILSELKSLDTHPLHEAAEEGQLDAVVDLIQANPNCVNFKNADDFTPLSLAAAKGNLKVVEELLRAGADPQAAGGLQAVFPLYQAAGGHPECLLCLLEHGASIDQITEIGDTALHKAAEIGCVQSVTVLLSKGADPNASNYHFETPLHFAAGCGSPTAVNELLLAGADVSVTNQLNETPLFWAVGRGCISSIQLLLQLGANVNAQDTNDETPLFWAVRNGDYQSALTLLQEGADPNVLNDQNQTPLNLALQRDNWHLVQLLRDRGATVSDPTTQALLYWFSSSNN